MSREIKFRVWSEEDREYRTDCHLKELFTSETGTPATIYNDEGDRFDIEQYTGLKDKNSKEIYEGDIVEYRTLRLSETSPTIDVIFDPARTVVEFEDGCFTPFNYNEDIVKLDPIEVIGNIHENPELLDKNDKV